MSADTWELFLDDVVAPRDELIVDIRDADNARSYLRLAHGSTRARQLRVPHRHVTGKRAFDLLAASIAVILLSPLLAVAALAIRLTSNGPAVFRQERVGLDGEIFTCLKFRTMVEDAEAKFVDMIFADEQFRDGFQNDLKAKDDPRVTRVGKTLRRLSIDELPQLINVIQGTMSLVGPRPMLAHEASRFEEELHTIVSVKPGLTGLWQVSGRNELGFAHRVSLDAHYARTATMRGDLKLLLRTVRVVATAKGAR